MRYPHPLQHPLNSPLLNRAQRSHESIAECLSRITTERDVLRVERARIARILDAFSRAPLSMASVQPLLDLAVEMNPRTKESQ